MPLDSCRGLGWLPGWLGLSGGGEGSRVGPRQLVSWNMNTCGTEAGEICRGSVAALWPLAPSSMIKAAGIICRGVHCEPRWPLLYGCCRVKSKQDLPVLKDWEDSCLCCGVFFSQGECFFMPSTLNIAGLVDGMMQVNEAVSFFFRCGYSQVLCSLCC